MTITLHSLYFIHKQVDHNTCIYILLALHLFLIQVVKYEILI